MRIPAPLPGFVPHGGPVVLPQASGTTLPNTERPNEPASDKTGIRPEFRKLLEQRLDGWLGEPGSEKHATVAKQARPFMGQDGDFRIDALPDDAKKELVKLQKAAERCV